MLMILATNVFGFVSIPITRMRNAVHAYPPGTGTGLTIQNAYDYLISSDRDAVMGTIGVLNRRTLILTPGVYTSIAILLSEDYVDIEGIGSVIITDTSGVVIDCASKITRISNITLDASSIANCLTNDTAAVCESVTVTDGTDIEILVDGLSGTLTYDQTNGQLLLGSGAILTQDQLLLTPVADAVGTTEGTVYYDSDTDKLTYRNSSSWVSLPGSAAAGGSDTEIQYNNGGTLDGITNLIWDDTDIVLLDDQDFAIGTGKDWKMQYDEGVDDQLLWITANTAAGAITDPMYEIIVGASPTADQQVWGVSKGTQVSNTSLIALDEDGDLTIGGVFYQAAIVAAASGNVNQTFDAAGNGTQTFGTTSTGKAVFVRAVELNGAVTLGDAAGDNITVTGTIVSNVTLDDGTTDSPTFTLQDATNETAVFVKLDNGDTTLTIPADTDFEIVAGNLAVGNGSPGTVAMDGEDLYVEGDAEFDGSVQFDGLPTGALGLTITGAAVNLNVSSNFAANICTGSSSGAITLGGGSGTFAVASTGVDISTAGAFTNVTDITLTGDITGTNGKAIRGSAVSAETYAIQVYDNDTGPGYKNALLMTNGNTPAIVLGNTDGTTAITSDDWAITITGVMTGIGAITNDGLITASAGATITGAAVNLNASSNFAVNINTGNSTGATSIGNALNDITVAGHIQGTNALVFDGSTAGNGFETTIAIEDPAVDAVMTVSNDTGSFAYTPTGKTTKDATDAALPITHAIVEGTSDADSAWTIANGAEGQILTVVIVTDGGSCIITPATKTGWATAVLDDDGDTLSLLYVDDTVGWVILGMIGIVGQPVITQ